MIPYSRPRLISNVSCPVDMLHLLWKTLLCSDIPEVVVVDFLAYYNFFIFFFLKVINLRIDCEIDVDCQSGISPLVHFFLFQMKSIESHHTIS